MSVELWYNDNEDCITDKTHVMTCYVESCVMYTAIVLCRQLCSVWIEQMTRSYGRCSVTQAVGYSGQNYSWTDLNVYCWVYRFLMHNNLHRKHIHSEPYNRILITSGNLK